MRFRLNHHQSRSGLTSTPGTQNTGSQSVTNTSTISLQSTPLLKTANYILDTSSSCVDTGTIPTANGSTSITFSLPASGGTCGLGGTSYNFADASGHGFTLAVAGAAATLSGGGLSGTSAALAANASAYCTSTGNSTGVGYLCQVSTPSSGSGTVTSVAMTVPSFLTVTGSPITSSGTLAVTATSESANLFLASPNGFSGAMTPRAIATADLTGAVGMEVDLFYGGVPGNSAVLAKTFSRSTTVAASAPIKCSAIVGATSSATVTLAHVVSGLSTNVGTAVFAASGSAYQGCTVTFSSSVTFAVGDLLTATFPGTADATLANVAISIPAVQ